MPAPDPSDLIRIFSGNTVFGRDTDSRILQAANGMSGRLMFELFLRRDTSRDGWAREFADELFELSTGDPSILVGFDDGRWQGRESADGELPDGESVTACDHYLRLEFTDEDASYYQFHLFPNLDESFLLGASRKREGAFQHLRVTLAHPDDFQVFIQRLRSNPHLKVVHDSSAEEFNAAPSHAM
jgi:hypothetical protein